MHPLDQAIGVLKAKLLRLAVSTLETPQGRDSFAYGRVCGVYEGIKMAVDTLEKILNDADQAERRL